MIGTMRHIEIMGRGDLTAQDAWAECLREASNPRFDKRTGRMVPIGVFVEARKTLIMNRPDLAEKLGIIGPKEGQ